MGSPSFETSPDIFPLAIACTGCATRYKIDKPRGFTCPHCGNHIQILGDGKVEIIPKVTMDREIEAIQELQEAPSLSSTGSATQISSQVERTTPHSGGRGEEAEEPYDKATEVSQKPEEKVFEIRAAAPKRSRRHIPVDESGSEIQDAEVVSESEVIAAPSQQLREEISTGLDDEADLQKERELKKEKELEKERELEEEIGREEARLAQLRKERELLDKKKHAAESALDRIKEKTERGRVAAVSTAQPHAVSAADGERKLDDKKKPSDKKESDAHDKGAPVIPSYYGKERKEVRLPFDGDVKKNALLALGIVAILLLSAIIYSVMINDDFSVRMPSEKIKDKGTYDVSGRIWASSPDGISTGSGVIQDLMIHLNGNMWFQINETTVQKDGFGIEHDTLDKYLFQDLDLSGSVDLFVGRTDIDRAGTLVTKSTSYISLVSNDTIRSKVYNDLDLDILSYFTLRSIDRGIYYPTGDNVDYNLFNLRNRDYSIGDEGDFAGGQLRWKAEKKEKIYKWDCIKLHITENNSDSNWREFSGNIWVANECSLPVKVDVHTRIDSTKLSRSQQFILSFFTSSEGFIEVDYTAVMKGYTRGDRSIPWDFFGEDPSVEQREGVRFDDTWIYAPLIANDSRSYDPDFSPEAAAEYAVNHPSELRSFVDRHEDEVYIVDGVYSMDNDTKYWQLLFGYRESGLNTDAIAYNITVKKSGSQIEIHSDPGKETINNPSNSRNEIDQAMNIADSETVYENMSYLSDLFSEDGIDFNDDSQGKTTFEIQNSYLHSGLTLSSSFNPFIQNTVPAGYGYYLQRERSVGSKLYLEEGMIDAQNGRIVYEIDHYQSGQF